MTPHDMEILADRLKSVLADEFGINTNKLTLNMQVENEYYESIRQNFPQNYRTDGIVLATAKKDWAIIITRRLIY